MAIAIDTEAILREPLKEKPIMRLFRDILPGEDRWRQKAIGEVLQVSRPSPD
jgi:hypothetical protein